MPRRRSPETLRMQFDRRQNLLIAGFLLLSLLLHLLLLLIPETGLLRTADQTQPVYVEVRPPERRTRELDLPPRPPLPKPRETPAKRLGPQDQTVKHEIAPPGRDSEDRVPRAPARRPQPQPQPQLPAPPAIALPASDLPLPPSPTGDRPAEAPAPEPTRAPSLQDLTTLPKTTVARLEQDWRRKLREGLDKGDTIWLDTEQDLLISFFKRFRTNIYNVWRYPADARLREEQGQCLLRIVVSREGTIDSVELLESSGSRDLDEEAMRAVRKGAPYGSLPAAYPYPKLNIMAYFRYSLTRRVIYGAPP